MKTGNCSRFFQGVNSKQVAQRSETVLRIGHRIPQHVFGRSLTQTLPSSRSGASRIETNSEGSVYSSFDDEVELTEAELPHHTAAEFERKAANGLAASSRRPVVEENISRQRLVTVERDSEVSYQTDAAENDEGLSASVHATRTAARLATLGRRKQRSTPVFSERRARPSRNDDVAKELGDVIDTAPVTAIVASTSDELILQLEDQRLDVENSEDLFLQRTFCDLAQMGRLAEACRLAQELVRADRADVLSRLAHKDFFVAARQQRAVKEAFRYVQLLPRQYADVRTYDMLIWVCVAANDLKSALAAADMYTSTGRRLDVRMYTTLISACAVEGNTARAFQLYQELKNEGQPLSSYIVTAMIKTCTEAVKLTKDRRAQLVTLERAYAVFNDARLAHVQLDQPAWNSLIAAAGRAGMFDRAFQALLDMQSAGVQPDERTYCSLVAVCGQAGEFKMAQQVYRRALHEGHVTNLPLYNAMVSACAQSKGQAQLEMALEVYSEVQRHGVQPDAQFFGILMVAVGRSGDVEMAFSLKADMEQRGLPPSQDTYSALMQVCIFNNMVNDARQLYNEMHSIGLVPTLAAYNSLINAYGKARRFGDAVSLVSDLVAAGLTPDEATYCSILNACTRAQAGQLAFDVLQAMRERGIRLNLSHCFSLLRICYDRIRAGWTAGGYPPKPNRAEVLTSNRHAEAILLMERLAGPVGPRNDEPEMSEGQWRTRAVAVYRETMSNGCTPTMRVLDRLMACLRKKLDLRLTDAGGEQDVSTQGLLLAAPGLKRTQLEQQLVTSSDIYDPRAVTLLEAAIYSGVLPQYKLDGKNTCQVDMRSMLPAVGEVYVLSILNALARREANSLRMCAPVVLLLPPFNLRSVFYPSYAKRLEDDPLQFQNWEAEVAEEQQTVAEVLGSGEFEGVMGAQALGHADAEGQGGERTALGVAGVLRNLNIKFVAVAEDGLITLPPWELEQWVRSANRTARAAEMAKNASLPQDLQQYNAQATVNANQRNIRQGLRRNPGPWNVRKTGGW